jgi:hypothetical protein
MTDADLPGSAEDQSWKSPRLRAQEKWIARFGVAALVAVLAAMVIGAWSFINLKPKSWTLTSAPVTLGPTWQTFAAGAPMRSGLTFFNAVLVLPRGDRPSAYFNDDFRGPDGSPLVLEAEAILVDGRAVPLRCCQFSEDKAGEHLIPLTSPEGVLIGAKVISVRIRSANPLHVREIDWTAIPDYP